MSFDLMMVGSRRTRHHLLAVNVRNQGDIKRAIQRAKDLVSAIIMDIIKEELTHSEFK